jgi:hypothetical protein
MKVLMVIFTLYMLLQNLNAWKNINIRTKDLQEKFNESYEESEKLLGKNPSLIYMITFVILTFLNICFYISAGSIIPNSPLFLLWSAIMVVVNIKTFMDVLKMLSTKKVPEVKWYSKLITPINSVYLLYFVYQYLFVL